MQTQTGGRARYGVDAPYVPAAMAAVALVALVAALLGVGVGLYATAALFALFCGVYLHATLRGKFRVWAELLDGNGLSGGETVLDMGCGRGAVLLAVARRLTTGRAIGVDLWRSVDQSGNALATTQRNAEVEGVADRVVLRTGDMTDLPVESASVDVVVSSLAIHNIPTVAGRERAIAEAVRVLRTGGRLIVVDLRNARVYRERLTALGMTDVVARGAGWRMWWGGPWVASTIVSARKP